MKPLNKKGVVGLNVLLTVVVMVFMIGFLVMIFAIMGGELEDEAKTTTNTTTITNVSTVGTVNETGAYPFGADARIDEYANCVLTITDASNNTGNGSITTTNYTTSGCRINPVGAHASWNNTVWNITGSYTWTPNTTASEVAFDTYNELGEVTDWFGIIIVITAMVVLILLTVIIITSIKGGGLGVSSGTPSTSA